MEFDQLLIRERASAAMGFESELHSATNHGTSIYPKLLGYFVIVKTMFMEFDQLLIREYAFTTAPSHFKNHSYPKDWCASQLKNYERTNETSNRSL